MADSIDDEANGKNAAGSDTQDILLAPQERLQQGYDENQVGEELTNHATPGRLETARRGALILCPN
jgi:hypothetical protein